jgi:RNA polymerase sigma-70 factor, ECF subfamily
MTYKEAYIQYRNAVYMTAYYYLQDEEDAKDVLQDVFVRYHNISENNNIKSLKDYLVISAKHRALDLIKSKKHRNTYIQYYMYMKSDIQEASKSLENSDIMKKINSILDKMRPLYSKAFRLRYMEEMEYEHIAAKLGISVSYSAICVSRAVEILRKFL